MLLFISAGSKLRREGEQGGRDRGRGQGERWGAEEKTERRKQIIKGDEGHGEDCRNVREGELPPAQGQPLRG